MSDRDRLIREVFARANAAGRRVFGFSSQYASCAEARTAKRKKKDDDEPDVKSGLVPDDWDRLAVEGDQVWTVLPEAEPARVARPAQPAGGV